MWRVMLSHPLPVVALVSRYLTNKLIGAGRSRADKSLVRKDIIRYYRTFP